MTPDVIKELNKQDPDSPFHAALLQRAKELVKMSRCEMSKHYDSWDLQDQVYRGERQPDREDKMVAAKGKPIKMVVPNTFAQVMTFTSFLFLMFNQNRTPYELCPSGDEDASTKQRDCELIINRDLRHNMFNTILFQHLLDVGRFGPSIIECCWTRKLSRAYITPEPTMQNVNGVQIDVRAGSEWRDFVKYEGNLVRNVSPYRFFPDTRHPLVDFQKGEFCAAEEEYSIGDLYDMQSMGEVAGVEFIEKLPKNWGDLRGGATRTPLALEQARPQQFSADNRSSVAIVTKMQIWLVPKKFKVGPGEKDVLGPEEFPILYHLWYANDNRVIRCEPAYWWHNEFGWTVAQFTPDMHHTLTLGLADLIYRLQDVIAWLYNSRIADVRRNIRGRNLINPAIVDTKSYDGEGDIYLRQGANGALLDRAIMPLRTNDVTAGHFQDAQTLSQIMEVVTGVNGNAMGQYNSGRRSARETAVVTSGAAGRMKMHGQLIWETSLGRLGRLMLSNARQSLSMESFARIIGTGVPDPVTGQSDVQARYAAFRGTPEEIICGDDYFVFDSTLSSEKGFIAQALQDLLSVLLSNPMAGMQYNLDANKILADIQWLRGAGSVSRFRMDPAEMQRQQQILMMQQAQMQPTA